MFLLSESVVEARIDILLYLLRVHDVCGRSRKSKPRVVPVAVGEKCRPNAIDSLRHSHGSHTRHSRHILDQTRWDICLKLSAPLKHHRTTPGNEQRFWLYSLSQVCSNDGEIFCTNIKYIKEGLFQPKLKCFRQILKDRAY